MVETLRAKIMGGIANMKHSISAVPQSLLGQCLTSHPHAGVAVMRTVKKGRVQKLRTRIAALHVLMEKCPHGDQHNILAGAHPCCIHALVLELLLDMQVCLVPQLM